MDPTSDNDIKRSSSQALGDMVGRLRRRFERTVYVSPEDQPAEPVSPYRARITSSPEQGDEGVEVREREVVRGAISVVYEVRCVCGRRWFNRRKERLQICPRCSRAVLLESD